MADKRNWFSKGISAIRAIGAGTTLWHFLTSQAAAVYVWGPVGTVWVSKDLIALLTMLAAAMWAGIWALSPRHPATRVVPMPADGSAPAGRP